MVWKLLSETYSIKFVSINSGYIKCPITFIRPQSLRTNTHSYFTRHYFGLTMEKFLNNKPAFFKATPPASVKPADLDKVRRNLERKNDDIEQASIPASVVNVPVVPQPAENKTLAKEKPMLESLKDSNNDGAKDVVRDPQFYSEYPKGPQFGEWEFRRTHYIMESANPQMMAESLYTPKKKE